MRNFLRLVLPVLLFVGWARNAGAQDKAHITLTAMHEKNGAVTVTLHSSKHFIFANNKYYLHIGGLEFSRYEQAKEGAKGTLKFIVPAADMDKAAENAPIYLSYGRVSRDGTGLDMLSRDESVPCWSLGNFSHSMIRK